MLSTAPLPGQSPPVAAVVCEVMCTVNVLAACVVPAGTVTGPHDSTPTLIEQLPAQPEPCLSTDQARPWFVGNVSCNTTPCASPSPAFQTVIVKPMSWPTFTAGASAVLRM